MVVTDARALYDLCRRAQLDVAVMARSAEALRTSVHWVPGMYMLADSLTKRLGNGTLGHAERKVRHHTHCPRAALGCTP